VADTALLVLKGSVALVTGARGGIGRAACGALTDAGAQVVASGRRDCPNGLRADAWLQHDVTSESGWADLIAEIRRRFGRLDCLVNNAGVSLVESIADTSIEQFRHVLRVNVESVLLGIRASLELLIESGLTRAGGAAIVNVSSVAGLRGVPLNAAYSASKGAVTLLTKSAAKEFAALGYPIRVNSVHPARVSTGMIDEIMTRYAQIASQPSAHARIAQAALSAQSPFGRMAYPQEVAAGIVFLCSPSASYLTGAELIIDGGVSA
jgi:NAD(P)-dependent dehydrogenase (short-subunit alcohol dehydrogenase family)